MRNVAQPFGTADPVRPNISATRWRTVCDLTNRVYYFESSTSPNIVWVTLKELDFADGRRQEARPDQRPRPHRRLFPSVRDGEAIRRPPAGPPQTLIDYDRGGPDAPVPILRLSATDLVIMKSRSRPCTSRPRPIRLERNLRRWDQVGQPAAD